MATESAGLRTHTLAGTGAALFMIVSKYDFSDVLSSQVGLDPSRSRRRSSPASGLSAAA